MATNSIAQVYSVVIGGCQQFGYVDKTSSFNGFQYWRVVLPDGSKHWLEQSNCQPVAWPPTEVEYRPRPRFIYASGQAGD